MNYFDDFQTRLQQGLQNFTNYASYVKNNVVDPLVVIGEAAQGNLTEQQIKAGQTGAPPPMAPPQNFITSGLNVMNIVALGAIAYLVYVAAKKRGK